MIVLSEICNQLGIAREALIQSETHTNFIFSQEINFTGSFNKDIVENLVQIFEQALTLTISEGEINYLEVNEGELPESLEDDIGEIQSNQDLTFTLGLNIDKTKILQSHLEDYQGSSFLFLFHENLKSYIQGGLIDFEGKFFVSNSERVIILSPDIEGCLRTPFILIDNLENPRMLNAFLLDEKVSPQLNLAHVKESLRWDGFDLRALSPQHFKITKLYSEDKLQNLYDIFRYYFLQTFLIFTANRTKSESDHFEFFYYSQEQSAKFSLKNVLHLPLSSIKSFDTVKNLSSWLLQENTNDRLLIFQKVVAREFVTSNGDTFSVLEQLPQIANKTKWNYNLFLEDTINRHFQQVRDATAYFKGIATDFSKRLETLTKTTADTFLGAIGTIVISFFAALLRFDIGGPVFLVAFSLYGLYLVVVQLGYRMISLWVDVRLLKLDLDEQESAYRVMLPEETFVEVTKRVKRAKNQFRIIYIVTAILYGVFGYILDVVASWIPISF